MLANGGLPIEVEMGSSGEKNDEAQVGYGRPPHHTRWRPGQTGNPKRKRGKAPPGADEIIDALLDKRLTVVRNGENQTLTGFQAIVVQLLAKVSLGNQGALKAFLRLIDTAPAPDDKKRILIRSSGPNYIEDTEPEKGAIKNPEGDDRKTCANDDE